MIPALCYQVMLLLKLMDTTTSLQLTTIIIAFKLLMRFSDQKEKAH
ncbi:hypothetical protein ALT1545_40222 [Alteromonas macleodii]